MFQSIWQALPTSIQPELTLIDWSIREIHYPRGVERVLVGYCTENREGRTSSAIESIDPKSLICTTASGRVYSLHGRPRHNSDADFVFSGWKRANDVTQTSDVTRELWEEHLRLTAGDQAQPD